MRKRTQIQLLLVVLALSAKLQAPSEEVRETVVKLRYNCARICTEGRNDGFYFELRVDAEGAEYQAWLLAGGAREDCLCSLDPHPDVNHHHDRPRGVYKESAWVPRDSALALSNTLRQTVRADEEERRARERREYQESEYFVRCEGRSHLPLPAGWHTIEWPCEPGGGFSSDLDDQDLSITKKFAHNSFIGEVRERLAQRWCAGETPDAPPLTQAQTQDFWSRNLVRLLDLH